MALENVTLSKISRTDLGLTTPYAAPETETETLIANLFAEVFNLDLVGANDDFLDLGGDSLIAEVFSMRLRERTGHDFKVSSLIESGSPKQIAAMLRQEKGQEFSAKAAVENDRPPVFVVHGRQGLTFPKPDFLRALAEGQKLHMFELPGLRGGHCHSRIKDIAEVYVTEVHKEYPKGPILLAAFCAGGLIALEMAAQLSQMGRPICQLVLLDPPMQKGSIGVGRMDDKNYWTLIQRAKARLQFMLPEFLMRPYLEFRYRRFLTRTSAMDPKWAELPFSARARAKLFMAFLYCRPRRYEGPVTILSSRMQTRALRAGSKLPDLLPQVRIELITKFHRDINGPDTARAMQEVFDAALKAQGPAATRQTV